MSEREREEKVRQFLSLYLSPNCAKFPDMTIIAAETTKLKLDHSASLEHQISPTLFHNKCDGNMSWTYILRVYLDGVLGRNPPPDYDENEDEWEEDTNNRQRSLSQTCNIL